jgi:hypothetical protein
MYQSTSKEDGMHRVLFFLLMLILLSPIPALAQEQQAVVKEFSGKVEVKPPGRDWRPVEVNMPVSMGATVSTGFASRLVLALGQTQISIRPLTRMLLRELVKTGSTNTTGLTLRVGKVNVAVKAASGEKNDFTIRGPASTAAVRGTEFNYDANVDDEIQDLVDSVSVTAGITGHTLTLYPGESVDSNGINLTYIQPSLNPPLNDLLSTLYGNPGWLAENRLPTSNSSSATITVRVN